MELQLKFNAKDWISILSKLNLSDTDPEDKKYGGFLEHEKPRVIAHNEERKIFREFLADLKKKKELDSLTLIDMPITKNNFISSSIWNIVEKYENKNLYYYTLLKNNQQPNYQKIVWQMSSDHKRNNACITLNYNKNEDSLLHIFKSAIAMCPPVDVQSAFKYFAQQWAQLDGIDSNKEVQEKRNEILSSFHKDMRQTDMFGNGHACSIIYELWCISNIVYRAFIAITEHLKEEELFKNSDPLIAKRKKNEY